MKELRDFFRRALAMDKELDPKGWRTNKEGNHYHINASGEIDAGMGGKFNGQKVGKGKSDGKQSTANTEKATEARFENAKRGIASAIEKAEKEYTFEKWKEENPRAYRQLKDSIDRIDAGDIDDLERSIKTAEGVERVMDKAFQDFKQKTIDEGNDVFYHNRGEFSSQERIEKRIKNAFVPGLDTRVGQRLRLAMLKDKLAELKKVSNTPNSEKSSEKTSQTKNNYISNKDVIDYWVKKRDNLGLASHGEKMFATERLRTALVDEYKAIPNSKNIDLSNRLDEDLYKELEDIYKNNGDNEKGSAIANEIDKRKKARADFMENRMDKGLPPMPQKSEFNVKYQDTRQEKSGLGKKSSKPKSSSSGRVYKDTSGNPVPKIPAEKLKKWSDDDLLNDIATHESWLRSYAGKVNSRRDVKENIPFVRSWLQDKKKEAKRRGLV